MAFGYPILLELSGRTCVVVGERAVRERKVEGLLAAGAEDVLVVAEGPEGRLDRLGDDPRVRVERRAWRPQDLDGATLVVAWVDEPRDRDRLAAEARARGVFVNVIDDVGNCDFAAPALVRRGELVVAIGTGGASPALARKLREELEQRFGPHWGELVEVIREVRWHVGPDLPADVSERSRRWQAALDLEEAERLIREGRADDLREVLIGRLLGAEVPT